mgnify:CR=1 FL=1
MTDYIGIPVNIPKREKREYCVYAIVLDAALFTAKDLLSH